MEKKADQIKEELTPKAEPAKQEELSNFKIQDKRFNKLKTYLEKNKKGNTERTIEADWRNINIQGIQMVVFKNKPLTKKQYRAFAIDKNDLPEMKETKKAQIEYWLEEIKKTKAAPKKETAK